jgi:hypothetical protein
VSQAFGSMVSGGQNTPYSLQGLHLGTTKGSEKWEVDLPLRHAN